MRKINPLRARYGAEKRWVNYRLEEVNGKMTKVPYSTTGRKASSTNPDTWATLDEAMKVSKFVGIVFTPERTLLGIDIDHCLNEAGEIEHGEKEKIERLIERADTYTEISPSATGLHMYLCLSEAVSLSASRHGNFEAYTAGRYFTVTGRPYGEQKEVREVDEMEAIALLSIIGYPWGKEVSNSGERKSIAGGGSDVVPEADIRIPEKSGNAEISGEEIVKKMFASKNGAEIKKLYEGDLSAHGNDNSKADMALCAHLAFWTGKDAAAMERIWMASPLGARPKTQNRPDYRARTISEAIAKCKNVYEARPAPTVEVIASSEDVARGEARTEIEFLVAPVGKLIVPVLNTENMIRILERHLAFKGNVRYDTFKNIMEYRGERGWRQIEDHDAITVQTAIQVLYPCFAKVGKAMIEDAMMEAARRNTIDSAADWMRALEWDGVGRLDKWLHVVYGTPDDEYHAKVGANCMKGIVNRVMRPGCKFDYVMVLEGEQGIKKSTSLGILGGEWYLETTMSPDNKDFFMQLQGKVIVEFSEGETMSRTETKRMKAVITTTVDKYRPAYGKQSIEYPRRCVFMMTTNQEEYLKDETGNRRWLPVKVEREADVKWLEEHRSQLYAEAYHRVITLKETTYEFPNDATRAAQEARQIKDPNGDAIASWYSKLSQTQRDEGITTNQVYRDALYGGFPNKPIDRYTEMMIANILKGVVGLRKERRMVDGIQANRWYAKDGILPFELIAPEPLTDLERF